MSDVPLLWEPYDRHWIRLRGPWDITWHDGEGGIESPRRVKLPASWSELFENRSGTARFERRFQRPTNLDADERVVITICEVKCTVMAMLNNETLSPLREPLGDPANVPGKDPLSFDVTDLLRSTNLLSLELSVSEPISSETPCGLWQPVFLEVITLV
ncbi:MAG: hypothetical protein KDA93_04625 [Planctomycetaceae bacterium]|nr:hypothetical protein [Planctomycetaceae bacterium]